MSVEANRGRAALLRQDARHYRGLSTGEAERLRGDILAGFEQGGLPDGALPAIREELRTSLSPVVLAGAARALRGAAALDEALRALLREAAERIAPRDEHVTFGGSPSAMTAGQEIAATLARPPSPSCCASAKGSVEAVAAAPFALCPSALERAMVEDQSGARARLAGLLSGRVSLVALFYTRCMNPAKCSLTITRLGDFVRHARAVRAGIDVLALSYDGRYDDPPRLYAFGRDRGFPYGDDARLIRCVSGWPGVRREFGLRVGYSEATVNAHARELFAVGPDLRARGLDPDALARPDSLARSVAEFADGPDQPRNN